MGGWITQVHAQAIECPAIQADINLVDFSRPECREFSFSDDQMHHGSVWIKIPFDLLNNPALSDTPLPRLSPAGLFISGNFSLDAYINGSYVGSKGQPGRDRVQEIAGPFDWVLFIDQRRLNTESNTLIVYASSHGNLLPDRGHFNRLHIGPFESTTGAYKQHYALSLIPLGTLFIVLIYMLNQRLRGAHQSASITLIILVTLAISQLLIELLRGFYNYPYPIHGIRLLAITFCAFLFGQGLLIYSLKHVTRRLSQSIVTVSGIATLSAQFMIQDFDFKAIAALQIPAVMGVLVMSAGLKWLKTGPRSHSITFILLYLCLLIGSLISQNDFLDSYFYFLIAALLMILAQRESDKGHRREQSFIDLQQQTEQLKQSAAKKKPLKTENTIRVKSAGDTLLLPVNSILCCQGAGDYVELVCKDKRLLYSGSLSQLHRDLPDNFLKVHRSYLVNTTFIKSIKRHASGNGELLLTDTLIVPVSRGHFSQVKNALLHM